MTAAALPVTAESDAAVHVLRALVAGLPPQASVALPNYPSPFNPETWIPFDLSAAADVAVTIYDPTGRAIRTLALRRLPAGAYRQRSRAAHWDGRNERGEAVASGAYFYRVRAGDYSETRRMVVLK